jgi:hypothetical protein
VLTIVRTLLLRPQRSLARSRETSVEVEAAEVHSEDHQERAGAAKEAAAVTRVGVAIISSSKTLVATSSKTGTTISSSKIIGVIVDFIKLSLAFINILWQVVVISKNGATRISRSSSGINKTSNLAGVEISKISTIADEAFVAVMLVVVEERSWRTWKRKLQQRSGWPVPRK